MSYTIDQLWLDGGTDYTMLSSRNLSLLDGKKLLFGTTKELLSLNKNSDKSPKKEAK